VLICYAATEANQCVISWKNKIIERKVVFKSLKMGNSSRIFIYWNQAKDHKHFLRFDPFPYISSKILFLLNHITS